MSLSLRDFLSQRSSELDALEAPLRDQLSRIEIERQEIRKTSRALDESNEPTNQAKEPKRKSGISQSTIKGAILHVLGESEFGSMKALEILQVVNAFLRSDYPRTSLSPQLSRLKADGRIVLNGKEWCLAPRKEIDPAHFKSGETNAQGHDSTSTPVEPGEEVEHDNTVASS